MKSYKGCFVFVMDVVYCRILFFCGDDESGLRWILTVFYIYCKAVLLTYHTSYLYLVPLESSHKEGSCSEPQASGGV